MRKFFVVIIVGLLNILPGLSQEVSTKAFSYRSFSVSPLGVFVAGNSGLALSADVSFDYGKNIFSLEIGVGSEVGVLQHNDNFSEANLLYGRNYPLSERMFMEFFVGAGYFHYNSYGIINAQRNLRGEINEHTIGFPIGGKLQFKLGRTYSMGIRLGANINSAQSIGTLGLVLQWNRK